MRPVSALVAVGLVALALPSLAAEEPVDLSLVTRIRDEGFRRSRVMETARRLTDHIGARVTGSPAMTRANEWTRDTLAEWGLENARLEAYRFGRGWSWSHCSLDLLGEAGKSLSAIPQAWTAGTSGPVEGEAVYLDASTPEDLESLEESFAGKFVLLDELEEVEPRDTAPFRRLTEESLREEQAFELPDVDDDDDEDGDASPWRTRLRKRVDFRRALDAFLAEQGALGILEVSSRDHGILRVPRGGSPVDPEPMRVPAVTVMTEQYNRLMRLLDDGQTVRLRLDVDAEFHGKADGEAFNTVAEIPGASRADELVIVGAHLDSYHAGTGATDNAGGVAVMMEAMRILTALDVRPARTVRIVLWSGEEQGLLGSKAYVDEHYAARPPWPEEELSLPRTLRSETGPLEFKPDHATVSAYFNVDNGGGKIRGIYGEEDAALRPIFEAWLAPLHDLGATTVTLNRTGGTDHRSFQAVGIPGFQFIQDPLDYFPQTHHTHVDTYDHLSEDDLRQAAVVVATVVAHAANRGEMLPRKPRPVE